MADVDANSDAVDPYRMVSLSASGIEATQYVIDTNVISHVERLIRGGAPDESSKKAAALCRELAQRPDILVIDDFAWIEGASFHQAAGLSPTSIVIRDVAARLLDSRPVDLLATVADLSGWQIPDGYESEVNGSLDTALSAMMLTVIPCYLAAVLLEERYGNTSPSSLTADDVIHVVTELSGQLTYVPGILFAALKLACIGTGASRTAVMRVLKTGRKTRKLKEYLPIRNALSAGWDLGVLQLLSAKLSQGVSAALVTSDEALADLGELITVYQPGVVILLDAAVDASATASTDGQRIDLAYALLRATAVPSFPTRHQAAEAVRQAESRIGATSTIPEVLERGASLNLPPLQFTDNDLLLIRSLLTEPAPDARRETLIAFLDGSEQVLRDRFDAMFMFSQTLIDLISTTLNITATDVLKPLGQQDDYGHDVATALLSFTRARQEPFTASVYRELLRRPEAIRIKLLSIAGGTRFIAHHWAETLHLSPEDLTQQAQHQLTLRLQASAS